MKVVNLQEMKNIESKSREIGFNETLIIENIGLNGSKVIEEKYKELNLINEIVFLIGKGNNGADAMAIARHLENRGYKTRAFLLFPDETPCETLKHQAEMAHAYGVRINEIREVEQLTHYFDQFTNKFFVVDGILGTGQTLPLSNYLYDINHAVNNYNNIVFAVDLPTGVCADSGKVISRAIIADFSLAIGLTKVGHYADEGPKFCGKIITINCGFSQIILEESSSKQLLNPKEVISSLEKRDQFGHKNTFGHCLVIGGTTGLTGALILASKAALKVGTGLVTAVTWESNYHELVSRITPEVMTNIIPEGSDRIAILSKLSNYDSIVLGPGIGQTQQARSLIVEIMNSFSGTLIIDADAINLLDIEQDTEMINNRKGPTILTPHLKEFSDLAMMAMDEVASNPYTSLTNIVDRLNCAIVLKGACTFLALPEGKIYINYFPNDGMATAGSGDVLAGILGGLLAGSHYDPTMTHLFNNKSSLYNALTVGISAHTLAGKHAADKLGVRSMSAQDIIDHLHVVFKNTH